MVATIKTMPAGNGYRYLTDQVAHHDEVRITDAGAGAKGPSLPMNDYYTSSGNQPGLWMGAGAQAIGVMGEVTDVQMENLFAHGRHPDFGTLRPVVFNEMLAACGNPETLPARVRRRLLVETDRRLRFGNAFGAYRTVEQRVTDRIRRLEKAGQNITPATRSNIEQEETAKKSRQAISGYDLTFTPVKSVSVLWGLGDRRTQEAVEAAHRAAVASAITWLEREVASARTGRSQVARHSVNGLIVAAFEHRTSRSGSPNLHTHAVVSAKVHATVGGEGRWLALDGTALFKAMVTVSEHYNTRMEDELRHRLGVRFAPRPGSGLDGKEPIREIDGVLLTLIEGFSARRRHIERVYDKLLTDYRNRYGHHPDRSTQHRLAQQACLSSRPRKEPGSTPASEREDWRLFAEGVLGTSAEAMLAAAVGRPVQPVVVTAEQLQGLAREVLDQVQDRRATWSARHVQAAAQRVTRDLHMPVLADRERLIAQVTTTVLEHSRLLTPVDAVPVPTELTRADGRSLFRPPAGEVYSGNPLVSWRHPFKRPGPAGPRPCSARS